MPKINKPSQDVPKMKKGGTTKNCWAGYEKKGSKTIFGKTYNNCVKK